APAAKAGIRGRAPGPGSVLETWPCSCRSEEAARDRARREAGPHGNAAGPGQGIDRAKGAPARGAIDATRPEADGIENRDAAALPGPRRGCLAGPRPRPARGQGRRLRATFAAKVGSQ